MRHLSLRRWPELAGGGRKERRGPEPAVLAGICGDRSQPWSERGVLVLPPDGHVPTEWSWDAADGSMEQSCARAVELGLPSIAFTEHADFTRWVIDRQVAARMRSRHRAGIGPDGRFSPPPMDTAGYLACVQSCRDRFPGLRSLSGTELGEPHWHKDEVKT